MGATRTQILTQNRQLLRFCSGAREQGMRSYSRVLFVDPDMGDEEAHEAEA